MKKLFIPFITIILACGCDSVWAQSNDSCAHALALEVLQYCDPDTFSSAGATGEPATVAPNPSCGFYKGGDVWFTVVMPASGALRYQVQGISGITPQTAIYTGSCGAMTQLLCMQLYYVKTIVNPALAGQTLYLRIFNYNNAGGGAFSICVWEPPVPTNNNCADAISLDVPDSCNAGTYTNAYSTPEPVSVAPNPSCGFYKGSDVWFTATMPASGALRIETSPSHAQSAIYHGSCGSLTQVVCNQLNPEKTFIDTAIAGETLFIRIFSYSSEDGAPFTLCLWEPPVPPNNDCAQAIALAVGNSCLPQAFTNASATAESSVVSPNPSCGFYKGGDVWFTAVMPPTGKMLLHRDNISGVNAQWAVYSGHCGDMSQVACAQLTSSMHIDNPALAGDTLYIRVFNYNSEEGGSFSFCVYDTTCNNNTDISHHYDTLCAGQDYVFPDGDTLYDISEAVVDSSHFYNQLFCDSLIITHLYVRSTLPPLSLPDTLTVNCGGPPLTLDAGQGYASYHWNTGDHSQSITTDLPGLYVVSVTGCLESPLSDSCVVLMAGPAVLGRLTYLNNAATPLCCSRVWLMTSSGQVVDSCEATQDGTYRFCGTVAGDYRLQATTTLPFGGINSIDAQAVLLHFTQVINLTGLRLQAADVDVNGTVNAIDALLIVRRFVDLISSFPAGDWILERPEFTFDGTSAQWVDIHATCTGDVNGSYVP